MFANVVPAILFTILVIYGKTIFLPVGSEIGICSQNLKMSTKPLPVAGNQGDYVLCLSEKHIDYPY